MFKKTALALAAALATFVLIVPTLASRAEPTRTSACTAHRVDDLPPVECPFCGGSFNHVEWTMKLMLSAQKRTLLRFIGV